MTKEPLKNALPCPGPKGTGCGKIADKIVKEWGYKGTHIRRFECPAGHRFNALYDDKTDKLRGTVPKSKPAEACQ